MQSDSRQCLYLLLCAVLALAAITVYWPARNHDFINLDDDVYVTDNPNIQSGLNWQSVKWALTTSYFSYWHPLTWLSHTLDWQLFGGKPGPQHLVNVFLHAANSLLLFIVLNRMTKRIWPSVFIAGLFALHPLNVESVAWIAERKNVLSTLFWFLTMLAYVRYSERPSPGRFIVAIVFFEMGLMSKPMLVTLPFVLLLLDYWPLGRFSASWRLIRNLILEKVPFVLLAGASCVITFISQKQVGTMAPIPFKERFANVICSYMDYIGKMFWPAHLGILYPFPAGFLPVAKVILDGIILILITALVFYYGRRFKYLPVGWLWYLGTLVPVIGIVHVGGQAMADRYTYVPLIGIFIIIAFGAADLFRNIPFRKAILAILASAVLLACAVAASIQLTYWKDSITLLDHTLTVIESKSPHIVSAASGRHLDEAFRFIPNSPVIHNNYGNALRKAGRIDEAIDYYKFALLLDPKYAPARYNLAISLGVKGRYDEAAEQCRIYLAAYPNDADMQTNLGIMLLKQGKLDEAVESIKKALRIDPNNQRTRDLLNSLTPTQPQN
jgi:protein O-mannosyl-transferase